MSMKQEPIDVSEGTRILVDPEDHDAVSKCRWHAHRVPAVGLVYWATTVGELEVYLGTFVLSLHNKVVGKNESVLYLNGNLADARKGNLVVVGMGTAMHRREVPKRGGLSVSTYLGVSQVIKRGEETGRWLAKIREGGKTLYLGVHPDETTAARAYDKAARQLHGEHARTNFPLSN